ncbi:MAG TPA: DUF4143 domain-containing protein, partial [Chryseolinea sp.]|nr:DUF4143 domain-containing protein [Chryseolinea sp.]
VIRSAFLQAGQRIKFESFGKSAYHSREMSEALRTVEKVMLLHLIYPVTSNTLPMLADIKKHPRLQVIDTGMLNYFVGIQKDILHTPDLNSIYAGKMMEHLAGQELLAFQYLSLSGLNFWVREKATSSAEIDFVYAFDGKLIPIEVKSGATGKLKSLHLFMEDAPHQKAVRFYADEWKWTNAVTKGGKEFRILNLPYYLVSQIHSYLNWFSTAE